MLATAELVLAVADDVRSHRLAPYVLDPVIVATSGDRLLEPDAVRAVTSALLPLAALVTPNLHEARILTGRDVGTVGEMRDAARALVDLGAQAALVKGGHLADEDAVDLLWDGSDERIWRRPRLPSRNTHGTGCALSAAVTAGLAQGLTLPDAVGIAIDFVARAIASAPGLGSGHGPIDLFVGVRLPAPSP